MLAVDIVHNAPYPGSAPGPAGCHGLATLRTLRGTGKPPFGTPLGKGHRKDVGGISREAEIKQAVSLLSPVIKISDIPPNHLFPLPSDSVVGDGHSD